MLARWQCQQCWLSTNRDQNNWHRVIIPHRVIIGLLYKRIGGLPNYSSFTGEVCPITAPSLGRSAQLQLPSLGRSAQLQLPSLGRSAQLQLPSLTNTTQSQHNTVAAISQPAITAQLSIGTDDKFRNWYQLQIATFTNTIDKYNWHRVIIQTK